MKYGLIQKLMFNAFKKSFKKQLNILDIDKTNRNKVMKKAKAKYKEIVLTIPKFTKEEPFLFNILNCAMFSSILLSINTKPTLEKATLYYRYSMLTNSLLVKFVKHSNSYTNKGREKLKQNAKASEKLTNKYSFKFSITETNNINDYTATFYTCGICYLMKELNLRDYIPAMCKLDYDMASLNNTRFYREYTLANNGPYCDCHYIHYQNKEDYLNSFEIENNKSKNL